MSHHRRAFAILEIKSVDDDAREIRGVATTPSVDAVGDVVNPAGASFSLPVPLLWMHDQRQPIGQVVAASVSAAGIAVTARLAKFTDAGPLKQRIDDGWLAIKAGLVRGLSIGFIGTATEPIRGGGTRFKAWRWIELSVCTIPSNADCSIVGVKSAFARADRARAQEHARHRVVHAGTSLASRPGVVYLNETGARKGVVYLDADDRQRVGRPGVVYLKR